MFLEFIFKIYQAFSLSFLFYQSLIIIWPTIYQFYNIAFMYQAYKLIDCNFNVSKATKQHQWSIVILMMIQHIHCKQTLLCHVAVESNLYFTYTTVLLHCIDTVMTRVVFRPFRLMNSYDHHGFLYILFVVEIIWLPLSALLWLYANTCSEWIEAKGTIIDAQIMYSKCMPSVRSEEHTSELQSRQSISYAVFCL